MFNVFLFLISCLLYFLSTKTFDITIISMDLVVFLLGSANLFKRNRGEFNFLSFNFIFLLSFFFCTYAYALFILGAGIDFSMTVFAFTNFHYITKGVSLSTIDITVYFIGYDSIRLRKAANISSFSLNTKKLNVIGIFRLIIALGVIGNTLLFVFENGTDRVAITTAAFLPELYRVFLIINLFMARASFRHKNVDLNDFLAINKWVLIESAIISLLYVYVGDRGLPISIAFIYLGVYSLFYKKISLAQFSIIAVVGVLFLFAIRVTRASENSLSSGGVTSVASATQEALSGQSAVLVFSDLMSASSEMCLGYEYVDKLGHQYPGKIILIPLQPIPFLPSIVAKAIWDKVPYELSPGSILNENLGRTFGYKSSLGNHIVIDIFMFWGVIGVVIFFALFGRLIGYLDQRKNSSMFLACSYLLAICYALYLPRDSIFTLLRPMFLIWFIDYCFKISSRKKEV